MANNIKFCFITTFSVVFRKINVLNCFDNVAQLSFEVWYSRPFKETGFDKAHRKRFG